MRCSKLKSCVFIGSLLILLINYYPNQSTFLRNFVEKMKIYGFSYVAPYTISMQKNPQFHIAIVVCGDDESRVEEMIVNIKSAVLFSHQLVKFHIFTEDILIKKITSSLEKWPEKVKSSFLYEIYSIQYPDDGHTEEWKKLFKRCASQRLFLPQILSNIELLLYVDTDVLFLSPVDEIWHHFTKFNSSHVSAMAPEQEQTSVAWYSRFARHPYYGKTGINSGVMLMNMSRLRDAAFKGDFQNEPMTWQKMLLPLYKKYKYNITWGDQDLLNIVFHHNPEMLYELTCQWNYRPDHCMYMPMCKSAVHDGVKVVHGCRRAFHVEKWPTFKAIYSAIKSFDFNDDLDQLLMGLESKLASVPETNCKKNIGALLSELNDTVTRKEEL